MEELYGGATGSSEQLELQLASVYLPGEYFTHCPSSHVNRSCTAGGGASLAWATQNNFSELAVQPAAVSAATCVCRQASQSALQFHWLQLHWHPGLGPREISRGEHSRARDSLHDDDGAPAAARSSSGSSSSSSRRLGGGGGRIAAAADTCAPRVK